MAIDFDSLFSKLSQMKVAVVGDVMLDTYMWGHVERISPEAPVHVVVQDKKEYRIGGAGNVALNTVSLGAHTTLFSVIGNDEDGHTLKRMLDKQGIQHEFIVQSTDRITTNKTRIISRNQQMMRLDSEMTNDITLEEENAMVKNFEQFIATEKPHVVLFEDYDKGVLTSNVIQQMLSICNRHKIITTVDPKRNHFFSYQGVTLFKPNLKEVKDGLNLLPGELNNENLPDIHKRLAEKINHQISLITLSEKGIFYASKDLSAIIPTHVRTIADVSGAGDTVIAVASLVYTATLDIHLAASVANIAGGIVCEDVGTAAISSQKLLAECKLLLQ